MKFGSSGVRGLAAELVGRPSGLYSEGFARRLRSTGFQQGEVFVGRDLRDSSQTIAEDCMAALAAGGFQPVDCGPLPTPALAFYARLRGAAALMVTGSHIPADRNGIKFYGARGEIDKADEAAITAHVAELSDQYPWPPARASWQAGHEQALAAFRDRIDRILPLGAFSGMKLGVYQHSTVAADLLVEVLRRYGADVVAVGKTEVFVPIDTEAVGQETMAKLKDWVREFKLDAMLSADADADRPLVIDENGELFRGDLIGLSTALFLRADTVVTPVTSNSGISGAFGFKVVRTKVGSPFVIAGMEAVQPASGIVVGFEANGGVLLGSDCLVNGRTLSALPTRDSFLPILAVLGTSALTGKSLSGLRETWNLPICASARLENFAVEASRGLMRKLADRDALRQFLAPFGTAADVDETDGLRARMTSGEIIHLRPSGNAPEFRCYAEAASHDRATEIVAMALQRARDTTLADD
ncbi:phosphomannomutase [Mesorhizobium sp. WSM4935]|uniref:phosphomannomutase n=1 Tax=Mesorhizobium sp. WSM4935 TaxID=3038547 RepID=UPI002414FC3E|nr:phosphomannomutase [Mesorhizobium sp. WSM4935]MDG4876488.1 phosphomannomutase [Mesorhizobium sp. WSM4935]